MFTEMSDSAQKSKSGLINGDYLKSLDASLLQVCVCLHRVLILLVVVRMFTLFFEWLCILHMCIIKINSNIGSCKQ